LYKIGDKKNLKKELIEIVALSLGKGFSETLFLLLPYAHLPNFEFEKCRQTYLTFYFPVFEQRVCIAQEVASFEVFHENGTVTSMYGPHMFAVLKSYYLLFSINVTRSNCGQNRYNWMAN